MAFTLTTDTITGESGLPETVIVVQDTNSTATNEQPTAIAIDYSGYLARIANALETIATQLTPVTPEAQTETLADQFARLRYLGDPNAEVVDDDGNHGTGIRQSTPWSLITSGLLYEGLINNGKLLSTTQEDITADNYQNFLNVIQNYNNVLVQKDINPEDPEAGTYNVVKTEAEQRLQNLMNEMRNNSVFNNYK